MQTPKIVFFAYHSITNLREYWQALKDKTPCVWVTFCPHVLEELKELKVENVCFRRMWAFDFRPYWIARVVNKIYRFYVELRLQKVIQTTLDRLDPDIIVSDTALLLLRYKPLRKNVMKVLAFHSVCYKKYFLHPFNMEYDLLLLPGENHHNRLVGNYDFIDSSQLQVIGWPRGDYLRQKKWSSEERAETLCSLGLDPSRKTVLYAPTHNAFYERGLFPRSFGDLPRSFENFCRCLTSLNVNVIVKMHPLSPKLIQDRRLHKIADNYKVCLAYKRSSFHLDTQLEMWLHLSDLLIGDVSGIIMDFMALDKPIVYIEPDHEEVSWKFADIPADLRAGEVVDSMNTLVEAVRRSLLDPQQHRLKRQQVLSRVLGPLDGGSAERGAKAITDYYPEFIRATKDSGFLSKRQEIKTMLRSQHGYLQGRFYD